MSNQDVELFNQSVFESLDSYQFDSWMIQLDMEHLSKEELISRKLRLEQIVSLLNKELEK